MIGRVALVAVAATNALAIDVTSRFDAGPEGWTLEGPGALEWVAGGGSAGGYLRVTRTGPGEVFLVAPAQFHGDLRGAGPAFAISYRPEVVVLPARGLSFEVSGPAGSFAAVTDGRFWWTDWTPVGRRLFAPPEQVLQDVRHIRIRLGSDPAAPVGEAMSVDLIGYRSCFANIDGSTASPALNANDFVSYLIAYAGNDPRAECDTNAGLSANDILCFMSMYSGGCR